MRRSSRGSVVVLTAVVALALAAPAAVAAVSSGWRSANECATLSVNLCSQVVTSAGSKKVTADDGSCAGQVGVSVKDGTTTSSAYFANTSITVTGSKISQYKVWH